MSYQFIPAYLCLFYLQRFFSFSFSSSRSTINHPTLWESTESKRSPKIFFWEFKCLLNLFSYPLLSLSLSLTLSRNLKYMCLSFYIKQTCYIFSWVLCLMPSNLPLIHLAAAAPFIILWSSGRSQPGVQSWSVADKSFAATWFLSLWRKKALDRGLGTLKLLGFAILGHWISFRMKLVRYRSRRIEVSRSLFVFGWQDETDIQIYKVQGLYRP